MKLTAARHRVLVFAKRRGGRLPLSYYEDWFDALSSHAGFRTDVVDTSTRASLAYGLLRARRRSYDLIVYPYGFFYENVGTWRRAMFTLGRGLRGTKVFFLENEYRFLRDKLAYAVAVGADFITTQLPKDAADRAYAPFFTPAQIVPLPHGLAVERGERRPREDGRDIDVGFRGASFPYYLGHRDRELITEYFVHHAVRLGLEVDVVTDDLLDRAAWRGFLGRCRAVLGHESGTDFLELNGGTRDRVSAYEAANPGVTLDELHRIFFKDYADPISGRCASSRHFDAIGARTCQILLTGRYNDILRPDEHYIALRRDLANIDDAVARFRDETYRRRMVEDTYAYARDGHTLGHRIAELVRWIGL